MAADPNELERMREALEGMVWQFAYRSGHGTLYSGGLSALEDAFEVLGWEDPYKVDPSYLCDEPGCRRFWDHATPTLDGPRTTCSEHVPHEAHKAWRAQRDDYHEELRP